ncbi:precorrin-8X/cobalt-precorrin-8 methylmutase [Anaerosolibacter carboniphilus]|uniref:Precorrin-8X/cobalt-precorrin-8 methylmutase n=1 Tax=Anaerosolibacter carboniphilus TaxID=1417629 RepID=A0A841KMV6_9FIRM|nr:precorrin-8X methylmutase [Anaerosolibacter carboniphilus]MBB6214601.1 precorrin-8X/cobalt-precorrin-8 methylmutase [Anaerosolibacter carboniphilus]
MSEYIKVPHEIEERSFEIITEELGDKTFPEEIGRIIKRIIHTTADFQYADITVISPTAIQSAKDAIAKGVSIVTDTQMAKSGINKMKLKKYGGDVHCFISDEDVALRAKEKGITRAMVSMEKAIADEKNQIFVIGNAPTALFELKRFIEEGAVKPALVVGVPVGFVGATESKEALEALDVPYILTRGRKGGSTVAAAIINAILYMME